MEDIAKGLDVGLNVGLDVGHDGGLDVGHGGGLEVGHEVEKVDEELVKAEDEGNEGFKEDAAGKPVEDDVAYIPSAGSLGVVQDWKHVSSCLMVGYIYILE